MRRIYDPTAPARRRAIRDAHGTIVRVDDTRDAIVGGVLLVICIIAIAFLIYML